MRIYIILTAVLILLAMCSCAARDYLAEAQDCGVGPECQELWDDWNKHEELMEFRERLAEFKRSCPDKSYLICYGTNAARDCIKHPNRLCRCECGTLDLSGIY